jgi:hypothetical protein
MEIICETNSCIKSKYCLLCDRELDNINIELYNQKLDDLKLLEITKTRLESQISHLKSTMNKMVIDIKKMLKDDHKIFISILKKDFIEDLKHYYNTLSYEPSKNRIRYSFKNDNNDRLRMDFKFNFLLEDILQYGYSEMLKSEIINVIDSTDVKFLKKGFTVNMEFINDEFTAYFNI